MIEYNGITYETYDINSIDSEFFEGNVYNLEVEDDHSYIVEDYIVKNCESFSFWSWAHLAYKNNYLYMDDSIPDLAKRIQAPTVNNVRLKGGSCKHILSVIDYLSRPFVLLKIAQDFNNFLAGKLSVNDTNDLNTQFQADAVKTWESKDALNYLGMTRQEILIDLAKTVKIERDMTLEDAILDMMGDASIQLPEDQGLKREVADKIIDTLDLQDEYAKMLGLNDEEGEANE